ncbi:MAG: site-specific DNA-methyltransferase [Myxococcales bacterium]|nr:site-specific DNA-methyltransferase [Myxococcales bacterium]
MAFPEAAGAPRAELWAADALATLDKLVADGRQVDLIHLDPPFGSEAAYDRKVTLSGASLNLTLRAYDDRDGDDLAGYLEGLYNVLCRARDALAPHGSLYLHLDPRRGPYARVLLDEIFGAQNFVNQIIWAYALGGSSRRNFQRKHDVIYLYARDRSQMYFNAPQEAATSSMLAGKGKLATDTWETTGQEDDSALLRDWPDELVRKTMSNRDPERTGYPTQKPLALVNRMVTASCPPGGLVVDPMSGSATLAVAAVLLGRNAIAGDRGAIARDVARARLLKAGASVHVDTLDEHMTVRDWPGHAPVVIRDDAVHLQQFEFPADLSASVVGSAAQDAVREVSRRDGRALLSGWGTAAVHAPTQLTTWVDAGPGRARPTVALQVPLSDGVTADIWWAIDVVGGFWTAPIKPSR